MSALYGQAQTLDAAGLDAWLERLDREAHPLLATLRQMLGERAPRNEREDGRDGPDHVDSCPRAVGGERLHQHIGPYRLLDRVGGGRAIEVWRAERDDGASQRTVALKLLRGRAGVAGRSTAYRRFRRERDVLSWLDHPNIAGLHDDGITAGGEPWLALEWVDGEPLNAWCDRVRIGVRARLGLFRQVLQAVEHAHSNLALHLDLQPRNLRIDAAGDVRVIGFGVAGPVAVGPGRGFSEPGTPSTLAYCSPEQLTGRRLTTASDVYSLGVVLYELLCGESPYELRTDLPVRLEQAIVESDPRPPGERLLTDAVATARGCRPTRLRRMLAGGLDAIACRALAKMPAQRQPSVESLRLEIDRWLAGQPVETGAPAAGDLAARPERRHRRGVSFAVTMVAMLLAVICAAMAFSFHPGGDSTPVPARTGRHGVDDDIGRTQRLTAAPQRDPRSISRRTASPRSITAIA